MSSRFKGTLYISQGVFQVKMHDSALSLYSDQLTNFMSTSPRSLAKTTTLPHHNKRLIAYALPPAASAAAFSAAILASIFLRASRIIWSLLFCRSDCLSSLLELHALPLGTASCSSAGWGDASLSLRLYLVIKSGCSGFSAGFEALTGVTVAPPVAVAEAPGGGGGWNVTGGYREMNQVSILLETTLV